MAAAPSLARLNRRARIETSTTARSTPMPTTSLARLNRRARIETYITQLKKDGRLVVSPGLTAGRGLKHDQRDKTREAATSRPA